MQNNQKQQNRITYFVLVVLFFIIYLKRNYLKDYIKKLGAKPQPKNAVPVASNNEAKFDSFIWHVLASEQPHKIVNGAYEYDLNAVSRDKKDIGGTTKFGISTKYDLNEVKKLGKNRIEDITLDDAISIYKSKYLKLLNTVLPLPNNLIYPVFDAFVLGGAVQILQMSLNDLGENLATDNALGKLTKAALEKHRNNSQLLNLFYKNRETYMRSRPTASDHLRGWLNRLAFVKKTNVQYGG